MAGLVPSNIDVEEPETNEEYDDFDDLPPPSSLADSSVIEHVMRAKEGNPSQFPSYWEMDEEDVDEATEEEIRTDPVKRTLWAAEHNHIEVLSELLEKDPQLLSARDSDGYTPLHRASYNGHIPVLEYLLEKGADVNARTVDGWTPLHSACRWEQTEVASMLLRHGSQINAQTNGGQTALHLAAANAESQNTLELLLMYPGIDASLQNKVGETARELCERNNQFGYLFEIVDDSINKLI